MSLDDCLGGKQFSRQHLLLGLELVNVECIGEVGLFELGAPSMHFVDTTLLQPDFALRGLSVRSERLNDGRPEPRLFGTADAESVKMAQHRALDALHTNVSLAAAGVVALPSEAVEVGVSTAVATSGDYDAHAGSAPSAVQHRFQRMGVLLGLVLGATAAGQDVLDGLKGDGVDKGLMPAGVFDPSERHEAGVVPVAQHAVSLGETDWTLRIAERGSLRQPPPVEFFAQAGDRVVPLGELRERPAHMIGPIRVRNDDADVFAIHPVASVEIPNRRDPRGAPKFGFLLHALLGFESQVAGVELGDRRHDAVQERAGWRLVDVLGGGDELGPCFADGEDDLDVVSPIARQSVNLVHDDEVDVALCGKSLEHRLELWTVSAAGGLAAVDVFVDDISTEPIGRSLAGVCLGLD